MAEESQTPSGDASRLDGTSGAALAQATCRIFSHFSERQILVQVGHEVLALCRCEAVFVSFAARKTQWRSGLHLFFARSQPDVDISPSSQSAIYALVRMLSRERRPLFLERQELPAAVTASLDQVYPGCDRLLAMPVFSTGERVAGCLVLVGAAPPHPEAELASLASSVGLAMQNAARFAIAQRDQERLSLFADATTDALWEWNAERSTMWWGSGIWKLLGDIVPPPDPSIEWKFSLVHADDVEACMASFAQALDSTQGVWSAEYRLRRANGATVFVEERVWFVRDINGTPSRVAGIIRDVGERKAMEAAQKTLEQMQQADRLKDQFLSMVSHELRTPLNAILGFSTLLEQEVSASLSPKHSGFLQLVTSSSHNLLALVNDLLDLQRLTSGRLEIAVRPLTLSDVVRETVERLQPLAQRRALHFELVVEPELPQVIADPQRLGQILSNLLGNAIKYTHESDTIIVRATAEDHAVRIEVIDHGPGIIAADMPRLFQRFSRLDKLTYGNEGGAGLGLSITKMLVEAHGGKIGLHSEGSGATFWFTLPSVMTESRTTAGI